jgi:uncharacterized protein with HEPN domain
MSRATPLRVRDYLAHIVEAIGNIDEYTSGMDAATYMSDRKTQDAVIRNLEVIGEACNNVVKHDTAFAASNASVPWNIAYEMRNALAHGYFKVDHQIVWQTLKADLPGFRQKVQGLLDTAT